MKQRSVTLALFAAALLLFTIGVASAELVTTNVLRSWDDGTGRYENGNLTMWLNDDPQPFYTQLDFSHQNNADKHPGACGVGTETYWAGDAEIGLYHTDTAQDDSAPGFLSSGSWSLVKCSTFATNKYPAPADVLTTCVSGNPEDGPCVIIGTPDVVTPCATGNCANEIVTAFHVNTDLDCDLTQDEPFASLWAADNLCLYWEGEKPPATPPLWGGNIQVRYGTSDGGEKTINFNDLRGPNAVTLSSVKAVAQANSGSLAAVAGGVLLAAAGVFVWRRKA